MRLKTASPRSSHLAQQWASTLAQVRLNIILIFHIPVSLDCLNWSTFIFIIIMKNPIFGIQIISGWWFQPLWKILVNWDDYSQYMGKYKMATKPPTSIWSTSFDRKTFRYTLIFENQVDSWFYESSNHRFLIDSPKGPREKQSVPFQRPVLWHQSHLSYEWGINCLRTVSVSIATYEKNVYL